MEFSDLITEAKLYYPALSLQESSPKAARRQLILVALLLTGLAAFAFFLGQAVPLSEFLTINQLQLFTQTIPAVVGSLSGCWLLMLLSKHWYYNSYYFEGLETILPEPNYSHVFVGYETAAILRDLERHGLFAGLAKNRYSAMVLLRSGIHPDIIAQLPATDPNTLKSLQLPDGQTLTPEVLFQHIFASSELFSSTLFTHGVQLEHLLGAARWVGHSLNESKKFRRTWGRDRLGRIPSLGKSWSYGQIPELKRYGHYVKETRAFFAVDLSSPQGKVEVDDIEHILVRDRDANVILVGEDGSGKTDIIARLTKTIQEGQAMPALEGYEVVTLDTQTLVAAFGSKQQLEQQLLRILGESAKAGNIVLVLPNLHSFIHSAQLVGSDIVALLDPFLASSSLHIIGTTNPSQFYSSIERHPKLVQYMEKVEVAGTNIEGTTRVLQDIALSQEARHGVFFPYPSLWEIAVSADRYITAGVIPDKAIDLLVQCATKAKSAGATVITTEFVKTIVAEKTGIQTGQISAKEQDILLNLEDRLARRVIGQTQAIQSVAGALRRSRAGVQNPKRPMGSFLFLGPTGVGKTEVSKALAEQFFGSEEAMARLDMSEYKTSDALDKLIGSFQTNKTGTLVRLLKERPYGLILLDEFEKSTNQVKDLFLQILDEGQFADMAGNTINARNTIIIATSNAGAGEIWDMFQRGQNPAEQKDVLIDHIVQEGIYKPELINRFDGSIVFHPLNPDQLVKIADLMLKKLAKRILKNKGIIVTFGPEVAHVVAQKGANPQFGARPMNRYIQDTVEQILATAIISGTLTTGGEVRITAEDLR